MEASVVRFYTVSVHWEAAAKKRAYAPSSRPTAGCALKTEAGFGKAHFNCANTFRGWAVLRLRGTHGHEAMKPCLSTNASSPAEEVATRTGQGRLTPLQLPSSNYGKHAFADSWWTEVVRRHEV